MFERCNSPSSPHMSPGGSPGGSSPVSRTMYTSNIIYRGSPELERDKVHVSANKPKRLSNRSLLHIHTTPPDFPPNISQSPDKAYLQSDPMSNWSEPGHSQRLTMSDGACKQKIDFDNDNKRLTQSLDNALIRKVKEPSPKTSTPKGNWKYSGEILDFLDDNPENAEFRSRCSTLPSKLRNKHLDGPLHMTKNRSHSNDMGQPSKRNRLSSTLDYKSPNSDPSTPTTPRSNIAFVRPSRVRSENVVTKKTASISSTSSTTPSTSSSDTTPMEPYSRSKSSTWSSGFFHSRKQSLSEPNLLDIKDLQDADTHNTWTSSTTDDTDSDNDKDDYGFLSYPSFRLRQDMLNSLCLTSPDIQKSMPGGGKTAAGGGGLSAATEAARAILPKKWRRSKPLATPSQIPSWSPEGSCTWVSAEGGRVSLQGTTLLQLTDKERLTIQRIALAKLQALNLGCQITIPKEYRNGKRSKKAGFSLKRRTGSSSLLDNLRDKARERELKDCGSNWVFGLPLGKVVCNDSELRRRRLHVDPERRESFDTIQAQQSSRASSYSSVSVTERLRMRKARNRTVAICYNNLPNSNSTHNAHGGGLSCDSFGEDNQRLGSNLLDALSLSSASRLHDHRSDVSSELRDQFCTPHTLRVPNIVKACCQHLETYGLHVLGIFRIGSSKKRTKQLREDFDSGNEIKLTEEHSPHDVAGILKEFFRDLSDPLLTRDLYSAFVATRKIKNSEERLSALKLLVSLLPTSNRDTLWSLLKFLNTVTEHSNDSVDSNGREVPGNKMDAHNLATLFGPNVLHKAKGGEFQVETLERADERKEVIAVVQECIENHNELFQVSAGLQDEALRLLWETSPDVVALLLKFKSSSSPIPSGMDIDQEMGSSTCETSDSSIPTSPLSPTITVEMDSPSARRTFSEKVYSPSPRPHSHVRKSRSSEPFTSDCSDHLGLPDRFQPERSASPSSPCLSPKAMKPTTPLLSIRVTSDTSNKPLSKTHPSPHVHQHRRSGGKSQASQQKNMLTVPGMRTKDADSQSSLSSGYYPGSSRSATASPATPDTHQTHKSWYLDTPPDSPRNSLCSKEASPSPFQRTSSTHRPLSLQNKMAAEAKESTSSDGGRSWQEDNWRQWKDLAQASSDEFHGQETLV